MNTMAPDGVSGEDRLVNARNGRAEPYCRFGGEGERPLWLPQQLVTASV